MALPRLRVSEIPAEGTQFDCQVQADELGLDPADLEARGEFSLHGDVFSVGEEVTVKGVLSGRAVRECVRCLKEYEDTCENSFAAQYYVREASASRPARRRAGPASQELPDEVAVLMEGERYAYSGEWIDLAPMLREQVILGIPLQPLCREDCQGLCSVCGQDRNPPSCGCSEEQLPSSFRIRRGRGQQRGSSSGRT